MGYRSAVGDGNTRFAANSGKESGDCRHIVCSAIRQQGPLLQPEAGHAQGVALSAEFFWRSMRFDDRLCAFSIGVAGSAVSPARELDQDIFFS
jgi:hypothetical protein